MEILVYYELILVIVQTLSTDGLRTWMQEDSEFY